MGAACLGICANRRPPACPRKAMQAALHSHHAQSPVRPCPRLLRRLPIARRRAVPSVREPYSPRRIRPRAPSRTARGRDPKCGRPIAAAGGIMRILPAHVIRPLRTIAGRFVARRRTKMESVRHHGGVSHRIGRLACHRGVSLSQNTMPCPRGTAHVQKRCPNSALFASEASAAYGHRASL